jgi:photosystem II stability/assembly factor-like uncharacterized protein
LVRLIFATVLVLAASGASLAAQTWTLLGPQPGRVAKIVSAPSQPATLYAVGDSATGGLWRSTNGGDSWQSISAGLCDLHVSDLVVHPQQAATIYAGTPHNGVCRSTDGGSTWELRSTGIGETFFGYPVPVSSLGIHSTTPDMLVAGTSGGVYITTNGGASWKAAGLGGVRTVAIAPSTPAAIYAALPMVPRRFGPNAEMYRSLDGGASWSLLESSFILPTALGLAHSMTVDPGDPNTVYAVSGVLHKTTNGGSSWTQIGFGSSNLVIDPSNRNILYIGAVSGVNTSTDGGASWKTLGAGLPSTGSFASPSSLAMASDNPHRLYVGTASGAYRSTDGAATWAPITSGVVSRPVTTLALAGDVPATVYLSAIGVSSANGNATGDPEPLKLPGGAQPFTPVNAPGQLQQWPPISIAADPYHPDVVFAVFAVDGTCGSIYKSLNGGASWARTDTPISPQFNGHCMNTLAIDPNAPATLYAAVKPSVFQVPDIYKTTDGGTTWSPLRPASYEEVFRVAVSRTNSNVLYATSTNAVLKSTDAGSTWAAIGTGLAFLPLEFERQIAIDPTDDNIVYLATALGVFVTTDGGVSWTARQNGWPTIHGLPHSARAIAIDPSNPSTIYASPASARPSGQPVNALGTGLYVSTDRGEHWAPVADLAGIFVNDVAFDGSRAVFAATDGGLFRLSRATSLPTVTLDRTLLMYGAVMTGSGFSSKTAAQTVRMTQTGAGTVTWTASASVPWLVIFPTSGNGPAVFSVSVQYAAGLGAVQVGAINLTVAGVTNTAGPITVTLTTVTGTAATAPIGAFDTPLEGATGVSGSIPVTGWALDDVAVTRVRILRDPVDPEPAGVQVYIGDAAFVDRARPDVEAFFPNQPLSTRAGWGYLLLTNFLPNLGNGTFRLYAYADDADGHSTLLGTKTITCANSTATKPFGAIDTPGQGATVNGVIDNFGWVLARVPARADPPFGTVVLLIDGIVVGAPAGWTARPDLSALFPATTYPGVDHALGIASIDTTALTNGVHTVAWLVTSNDGQTDGIGSRYITVSNAVGAVTASPEASATRFSSLFAAEAEPIPTSVVEGRHGFDLLAPFEALARDAAGRWVLRGEEIGRFEIRLGVGTGCLASGWLRTGAGLDALPPGAHLDATTGTFTWQPGLGFVGAYDFVFECRAGDRAVTRHDVRLIVEPKRASDDRR